MCVIVLQPVGSYLTKEEAHQCWKTNPHGAGFAFHNEEGLHVQKYMEWNQFWPAFESARSKHRGSDFLLHFRVGTHGLNDITNVHPFKIADDVVMAHNGVIHQVPDYGDGRSDTRVFIDEVLPELTSDWYKKPYVREMVGDFIGWSKLAILYPGGWSLVNEASGSWSNDMWFSNLYHRPGFSKSTKKSSTTSTKATTSSGPFRSSDYYNDFSWDDEDVFGEIVSKEAEELDDWNLSEIAEQGSVALIVTAEQHKQGDIITDLLDARKRMAHRYPFLYVEEDKGYRCNGCWGRIKKHGGCDCYDVGCADCLCLVGFCECPAGYPNKILENAELKEARKAANWSPMKGLNKGKEVSTATNSSAKGDE